MRGALLASLLVGGLLSGCSQPEPPAPVLVAASQAVEGDTVDWSATIAGFCTRLAGAHFCGTGITTSGAAEAEPTYVHDAGGRDLLGGDLTLDWDAEMPGTEQLRVVVSALTGCPDDCEANRSLASAMGPSPLTVQVPAMAWGEGLAVAVRVELVDFAQGTQASTGQPLHLSGSLSFAEPAPSAARADPDEDPDGKSRLR